MLLHTFENYAFGASEIDTPIKDPKLDGRFVERIRGSDRESLIGILKKAGTQVSTPRPMINVPAPDKRTGPMIKAYRAIAPKKRPMIIFSIF